ncbi:hypothetical protein C7477_1512 [Phyllobacterium leguminum]|uniref:Uncharacterized protein n=1 Tax=Phyllobacterium leguminum TaxID=314237 RepID=A0A318SS52_9HYPH|nr:hypothetical protein C7477_1512 [Phyllobacterium leguminum]
MIDFIYGLTSAVSVALFVLTVAVWIVAPSYAERANSRERTPRG